MKMDRKIPGFASKGTVVLPDGWSHSQMMGNFAFRLLLHKAGKRAVKSSKVSSLALIATLTEQLLLYLPNYCWTFLLCLLIIWVSGRCSTSARKGRFIIQNFSRQNQHLPTLPFSKFFLLSTENHLWQQTKAETVLCYRVCRITGKSLCFELASTQLRKRFLK